MLHTNESNKLECRKPVARKGSRRKVNNRHLAEPDSTSSYSDSSSSSSSSECSSINVCEIGIDVGDTWQIISKLGSGGFGAVYEVFNVADSQKQSYALKIEAPKRKNQHLMRLEAKVLSRLQGSKHACILMGCGYWQDLAYVVMGLVGPDLLDIKHALTNNRFSLSTAIRIGIQALEAIEDVHAIGFLHRDIKPSNFAMGASSVTSRTVFILDFGMARSFVTEDGFHRRKREEAGFRGTTRYASVGTLSYRDMGRTDDLWSLYYVLIEFIRGRLPWRNLSRRRPNRDLKHDIDSLDLLKGCPEELLRFHGTLAKYGFKDSPDYRKLEAILRSVLTRKGIDPWEPFDWEKPNAFESPKAQQSLLSKMFDRCKRLVKTT